MSKAGGDPSRLSFDDASEVVALLLEHVERIERKAAEMDRYHGAKVPYGDLTLTWADSKYEELTARAKAIRGFARETLLNARIEGAGS